jgi:hypothetical protein
MPIYGLSRDSVYLSSSAGLSFYLVEFLQISGNGSRPLDGPLDPIAKNALRLYNEIWAAKVTPTPY